MKIYRHTSKTQNHAHTYVVYNLTARSKITQIFVVHDSLSLSHEADNDTSETESDTENSNFEDEDPDNQSDLEEEEEEENSHLPPNNFEDPELDAEMEDEDSEDPEFMEEDSSDEINNNKRRKTYDLSPTAEKSKNRRKKSKHTFDGVESPSSDEEEDMIRVTA